MATNEERVRRIIDDIVDGGDYTLMPELVAPDVVEHSPMGDIVGHDGFTGFLEQFRGAMPGFVHEVSDVKDMGNGYVVFHVAFTGTFTGEFMGATGDGRTVTLSVANGARFEDGKLKEHWGLGPDTGAAIMEQMGIAPAIV